jgi:hypothetical protein
MATVGLDREPELDGMEAPRSLAELPRDYVWGGREDGEEEGPGKVF